MSEQENISPRYIKILPQTSISESSDKRSVFRIDAHENQHIAINPLAYVELAPHNISFDTIQPAETIQLEIHVELRLMKTLML